jgi:anti-anti-sigma regulatory factor
MLDAMRCLKGLPGDGSLEGPIEWSDGIPCPDCDRQCEQLIAWKRDVALEISVDVESVPVIIRLAGTLDGETAVNLMGLTSELIRDGHHEFELKTRVLCVPDEEGLGALMALQRLIQKSGGHLVWGGATANLHIRARSPIRP